MLLTALGLVLVLAAAIFVAWPMLHGEDASTVTNDAAPGTAPLRALESRRDAALGALKEAEFDHQVGKLSDEDYAGLRADLEVRALEALAALDAARSNDAALDAGEPEGRGLVPAQRDSSPAAASEEPRRVTPAKSGSGAARGARYCASCGGRNPRDKAFCAGCGKALGAAAPPSRRRA